MTPHDALPHEDEIGAPPMLRSKGYRGVGMSAVQGRCEQGHHWVTTPSGKTLCLWCETPKSEEPQ